MRCVLLHEARVKCKCLSKRHKYNRRRLAQLSKAPIHERRTFPQLSGDFRQASPEALGIGYFEEEHLVVAQADLHHRAGDIVAERRHAIDPRVHVGTVERGEAERALAFSVEARPIENRSGIDSDARNAGLNVIDVAMQWVERSSAATQR